MRCDDPILKIYMEFKFIYKKLYEISFSFFTYAFKEKYFTWVSSQFFSEFLFSVSIIWKKALLKNSVEILDPWISEITALY